MVTAVVCLLAPALAQSAGSVGRQRGATTLIHCTICRHQHRNQTAPQCYSRNLSIKAGKVDASKMQFFPGRARSVFSLNAVIIYCVCLQTKPLKAGWHKKSNRENKSATSGQQLPHLLNQRGNSKRGAIMSASVLWEERMVEKTGPCHSPGSPVWPTPLRSIPYTGM